MWESEASFFVPQLNATETETSHCESNTLESSVFSHDFEDKSKTTVAVKKMKSFISVLHSKVASMNLSQKETTGVYTLFDGLMQQTTEFYETLIEENSSTSTSHLLEQSSDLIRKELKQQSTVFKRRKKFSENPFYVQPQEIAIGMRWERKKIKRRGRSIWVPRLIQSTFQYVPIVQTLQTLFKSKEFREMYFQYNANKNHQCNEGTYFDYCCGSTFSKEFFKKNPDCLKIQLYCDEFEICNPLQSKAGVHKVLAVYFSIRNIPPEYRSRLNNIYLVCLVNSNDLKTKTTDYNNVWRPILRDLQFLEEIGINVDGKCVKGVLSHISTDNYGGNESLGFAASFAAAYYCRFCLLSKIECQSATTYDPNTCRTLMDYENQLKIVEDSEKVVYAETKGVKYYCVLNDLQNFHLIDNPTCDITHDHNEGSIPLLLKNFFELCIKLKCFEADHLNFMFQFHEYGWLNRKNIPSEIFLDKRSLGQNASQSICLFRNLPFVLYRYKDVSELGPMWKCIRLLLQFLVIAYSRELSEQDLTELESIASQFLSQFLECTEEHVHITPKLHLMLHYGPITRKLGPVVDMSTIRYEAKHQHFKKITRRTNNFRNINKTMATRHQQQACLQGFSIRDEIEHTKKKHIHLNTLTEYKEYLVGHEKFSADLMEIDWLRFNGFEYRESILIIQNGTFHAIHKIFTVEEKYYFLCRPFEIIYFDGFLNSYNVKEKCTSLPILIELAALKNKKSYEAKWLGEKMYVIEEDLEIRKSCYSNSQ